MFVSSIVVSRKQLQRQPLPRLAAASVAIMLWASVSASANLINEFQPNPVGTDPTEVSIELKGTPNTSFAGFLSSIDMDAGGSGLGVIDRSNSVSGIYDANGLAVVSIPDLENPGFTFVFSTLDGGGFGVDVDADDDTVIDDISVFGAVFDAVSIPDDSTDSGYYAGQLGGQDFVFTGDEPKLAFRDGTTGAWYAVNDEGNVPESVFDINGIQVANMDFDMDPEVTTFGSQNPSLIPEPTAGLLGLLGMVSVCLLRRRV